LDRGGRIRTLYQATVRHFPIVTARHERLQGDVEVRALDEVMDRLILIDREVAFLPADKDGSVAIEIRHPAIVTYLCTAFDRFWRLAPPMYLRTADLRSVNGVTPRQRAIAQLPTEGHTGAVIAERLGMNVRTARVHIANLAATLGSSRRAQLGYLSARSGILDPEAFAGPPAGAGGRPGRPGRCARPTGCGWPRPGSRRAGRCARGRCARLCRAARR